ncbi:MAG TPA: hypothetical protein VFH82_08890 [Gemmatimonadota bacterium]|jgi:hypothetical protein|nr:hypothetical protein [Gemmatimonadota bacterium]
MRAIIAGFIAATLYSLAIAALIATAMPSQEELQAIDASYLANVSDVIQIVEAESNPPATVQ